MIMKREYIKPAIEIVELASEQLMYVTSGEQIGAGSGKGSASDDDPELGRRRRGTWGNLWE